MRNMNNSKIKILSLFKILLSNKKIRKTNIIIKEIRKGNIFENLCIFWATALMLEVKDIKKSYKTLLDQPSAEGIVGISETKEYYPSMIFNKRNYLEPLYKNKKITSMRTQDYPITYIDNGQMAWVRIKAFLKQKTWMPKKILGYKMPKNKSVDLDNKDDLKILEFYYNRVRRLVV